MIKLLSFSVLITLALSNGFCQKFSEYQTGVYYDLKGIPHEGFIYYNKHVDHFIKFKANSESNIVKLKPWKLTSFTILEDSFIVFNNFHYEGPGGGLTAEIMDFVQVMDTGFFNLYKHYAILSSGPPIPQPGFSISISAKWDLENYLLTQKGRNDIVLVRKSNDKKFTEQMMEYFKQYPEIIEKIELGEYQWEDMPKIIKLANTKSP